MDYCTYNLQRQQGEAIDYNALRDMKFSGNDMLRGKLEDLLTATRKEQAQVGSGAGRGGVGVGVGAAKRRSYQRGLVGWKWLF